VLARLDHPGLLAVYDAGDDAGDDADRGFVVTPPVEGPTLAERLEAGALTVAETVDVGVALAGALGCVHRVGLAHRAISPSAVLLDAAGRCYLGDWGLAASPAPAAVTADPAITPTLRFPGASRSRPRARLLAATCRPSRSPGLQSVSPPTSMPWGWCCWNA